MIETYAFVSTCGVQDNYRAPKEVVIPSEIEGQPDEIGTVDAWVARLIIAYDILDADRKPVRQEIKIHTSEPSESRRTVAEVTEWAAANRDAFIAADKLELVGYQEEYQ